MLTPQKKLWSGWSLPGPAGQNNGEALEKRSNVNVSSQEDEQSMMNMRHKLSELGNELYDYQYQMGLLLIEKKEWILNYEKLQQAFSEKKDTLNRKQAAISVMEKREEDLRKALGAEKQCVIDLEKALQKMRSQHAGIKFTSDLKLVEANALVTGIRERKLQEGKKIVLKLKNDDLEFEMEQKRKSLEDDLRSKVIQVEKKVDIVNGMEEKVLKREQELDRKNGRLKEREMDFEAKFKDLEKRENSLSVEEKRMETEKKQLMLEEEKLLSLKAQLVKSREDTEEERQRIKYESEILKLTEEERLGHSLLQLELKQEIDQCKSQREQLLKEREDLKQEKHRFEKEWEDLDDKIRLSDEERDIEINEINILKEAVGKEMEEMRLVSSRIENEKHEILTNQKHLDEQQLEMRRNNDELVNLSNKLKELREQFFKEKEHFLTFVEKHKSCKNCGDPFLEFVHPNLQFIASPDDIKTLTLPHFTDFYSKGHRSIHDRPVSEATSRAVDSGSPASTGTMSWLQQCTSKILNLSSGKKNDPAYTNQNLSKKHVHIESPKERLFSTDDDSELQFGIAEDNLDLKNMQYNDSSREVGNGLNPAVNEQSKSNGEAHIVVEGSQHLDQKLDPPKRGKRGRGKANVRSAVKTNVIDVKLVRGNAPELNKNEHSKLNQAGKQMQRKWRHSRASRRKRSDSDYTYSGRDSDSEIAGGRRKRRHKVVPPVQTTSGQRYNFRQRKIEAKSGPNTGK